MKKFIFIILIFSFLLSAFSFTLAQKDEIEINFFYNTTCPYCIKEKKFLEELEKKYPEIKVNKFVFSKKENIDLLKKFYYQEYDVPLGKQGYVPITFIKDKYFLGFNEKIGEDIDNLISELTSKEPRESIIPSGGQIEEIITPIDSEKKVNLPIIGEIDIKKYSLPALAVILGILDGFNVCSLGALVLILGLVLVSRSKKKILIFGGIYILTTAIVYGVLIFVWYQIFSIFTSYLRIMETLIGLLAVGGGIYLFREFIKYRKQGPVCEIENKSKIITKFSSKFQEMIKGSRNIFLLIGFVFLFAIIITIIEFPCSAVVPVIFVGVLSQAGLSTFHYLLYIAIFILFYMLDEIIVFLIAFFTMTVWIASNKAITWITLVGSIILLLFGFYYLFGL